MPISAEAKAKEDRKEMDLLSRMHIMADRSREKVKTVTPQLVPRHNWSPRTICGKLCYHRWSPGPSMAVMDDPLCRKWSVTRYLVRVHKWSGRTNYDEHKRSPRTIYVAISGPPKT